ncbi:hypothetical protein Tco_1289045 [Tanacetum coccineum]
MSDSEDSTVTYTAVSSAFGRVRLSGSLGVEDHPLCQRTICHYLLCSTTEDSPGYVPESYPEEEPKEDDEDPEEDPADYLADRDAADDDDEDEDEDEEEEHPARPTSVHLYYLLTTGQTCPRLHYHLGRGWVLTCPRYEIGESSAAAATRPIGGRRADYGFVGTMDTEIRRRRAEEVGYGIRDVWIDPREAVEEEQDTQDIYAVIGDTQDRQTQIYQSVETLFDDSQYHYKTARLLDQEALQAVISQLQAADRRSQVVTSEMLQANHQRQILGGVTQKVRHSLMHQGRLVAVPRFGYAVAMLCSLLSIMGYSQLADCIDLLFCLATQYRSFVQVLSILYSILSVTGIMFSCNLKKMAPKRRTTRLNPSATPTPVTDTHTTTSVTNSQIQAMINKGVTAALAARDATRNGDDSHTSGTCARRPVHVAYECTYPNFLKCQPLNFKGTKGVVGLTQWLEKMESVYSISNCTVACQVKFATCTLQGNALTWWNLINA